MVKRISGNPPPRAPGGPSKVGAAGGIKSTGGVQKTESVKGPDAVQSKTPIQTTGVQSVGAVGNVGKGDRAARIRNSTRPLTSEERKYLLELVSEEAEKMFADGKVSPKKRQIIETSVKMTLAAGGADGDDDEER